MVSMSIPFAYGFYVDPLFIVSMSALFAYGFYISALFAYGVGLLCFLFRFEQDVVNMAPIHISLCFYRFNTPSNGFLFQYFENTNTFSHKCYE